MLMAMAMKIRKSQSVKFIRDLKSFCLHAFESSVENFYD
jgi:hypothetical protein